VPNLRFPGFTEEWEEKMLGDVAPLQRGFDLPVDNIKKGLYPVVFSNGILKFHNAFKVKGPGVVTGRSGTIGKVNFVDNDYWPHNTSLWVTDFKGNIPKYIFYFYSKYNLERFGTGSGVPTLNRNDVHIQKEYFPLPVEQEKIASFLSVLDQRIQTQNKIIEELDVLKNVFSQRIFSQELRFQDNNGSNYPDWETKKLKEVCDINPKIKNIPNSFYYIDLESVVSGRLLKENRILKDEAPSRAQRFLEKNDVLFQMVRPYQKNNLFFNKDGEYVASTGYAQIRTKQNSQFIFQYLHNQRFVDKVIERCTGTSYPAISSTDLGNIEIDYPGLAEQIKIADFLLSVDKKNDIETKLLKKLEEQKKFLLQQMFI
ncbi:restriction endonuclease subunit S, partial [Flavobacterium sp. LS2R12]|uniref:restriction endonuclease subunit S n=1 Tax=unclassified Flavobacterium TaxID=196869 RepID=UPI003AABF85D